MSTNFSPDNARHQEPTLTTTPLIQKYHAVGSMLFGFLWISESQLSLEDISIDNRVNPCLVRVTIKQSKTDPFHKGMHIYLGTTDSSVCSMVGVLPYLALRGTQDGPLFITEYGEGLTRQIFSASLDLLLAKLQLSPNYYNSHSFCIGAATSAAQANIPDSYIKMFGC